jgi:hypothetical protein
MAKRKYNKKQSEPKTPQVESEEILGSEEPVLDLKQAMNYFKLTDRKRFVAQKVFKSENKKVSVWEAEFLKSKIIQ